MLVRAEEITKENLENLVKKLELVMWEGLAKHHMIVAILDLLRVTKTAFEKD